MSRGSDPRQLRERIESLAGHLRLHGDKLTGGLSGARALAEELSRAHADPRLRRLRAVLDSLAADARAARALVEADHLPSIRDAVSALETADRDARLGRLLVSLGPGGDDDSILSTLLVALIGAVDAERGFVLLYRHDTTEAAVVAARDFETQVLAAEEYAFSRSLLADLFDANRPIRLADAQTEPGYRDATSVRDLRLRSVLAVPLAVGERSVGAVYLEDRRRPAAFDAADQELVERACAVAARQLASAGRPALTVPRARRCYLDPGRAGVEIVGRSRAIVGVLEQVRRLAGKPVTVLVEGETGTGKELVARAIHTLSERRARPFVALNCGAIPETLLESELFGHERGSFTGATAANPGQISRADGGTLFLDEINELAPAVQAKLLRFLETGEVDRLGRRRPIRVDVRVVAASSRSLGAEAASGRFHNALFYRLNVVRLDLPPLCARREDIPLLVEHFAAQAARRFGTSLHLPPEVVAWIATCRLPGNVRQLRNLIDRLFALSTGDRVRLADVVSMADELGADGAATVALGDRHDGLLSRPVDSFAELEARRRDVRARLASLREQMIDGALADHDDKVSAAAAALGVDRRTLYKYLRSRA